MNYLISIIKNWLSPKPKLSRIEQFVLTNYPAYKGHSRVIGYDSKPFATVDFIKAIGSELGVTITRKSCEEMLLKLGYERKLYRRPYERVQLVYWLIK